MRRMSVSNVISFNVFCRAPAPAQDCQNRSEPSPQTTTLCTPESIQYGTCVKNNDSSRERSDLFPFREIQKLQQHVREVLATLSYRASNSLLDEPRTRNPFLMHQYRCKRQANEDSNHCGGDTGFLQVLFAPHAQVTKDFCCNQARRPRELEACVKD